MYTLINQGKIPKISITASKKVAKTAVLRNKLRRRGYTAVRPLLHRLSPGSALLISYLAPDTKVSIPEMTEELKAAFLKTGLYR